MQQKVLEAIKIHGKENYLRSGVERLATKIKTNWTLQQACTELQLNRHQLKLLLDDGVFRAIQKPSPLNRNWIIDREQCKSVILNLKSKASNLDVYGKTYSLPGIQKLGYSLFQLVIAMQTGTIAYNLNIDPHQPFSFKQFVNYRQVDW